MYKTRWMLAAAALLIIGLAWFQTLQASAGLTERTFTQDGVPLRYLVRKDQAGQIPGVIVAHGFAGSQQLMLGYGLTLAQAGYAVILLDFAGHGSNANPMDMGGAALQASLEAAYRGLIAQPEVNLNQIALVGHSMGSGAVMQAGITYPERYTAVVALSPTQAEVSPTLPRNLFLQAGELEGRFVENAQRLLSAAGGENPQTENGLGRKFSIIPNVEHITILFNPLSHTQARDWLNTVFSHPTTQPYTDRRMLWYALHLGGWLLLGAACAPLIQKRTAPKAHTPAPFNRAASWVGLLAAPLLATGLLWLLNSATPVRALGGMLVGGALALWFFFFGLGWLGIPVLWRFLQSKTQPTSKTPPFLASMDSRTLLAGLGLFAFLWLAFGWMSQFTWLNWLLIPRRLALWPLFALACLPWQIAFGRAQENSRLSGKAGLWLAQSGLLIGAFLLLNLVVPGMGVLVLYIPAIPLLVLVLALAASNFKYSRAVALGNALFFGWIIAVLFPLV